MARFVGEALRPEIHTFDTARMAAGEPGFPSAFRWHAETIRVTAVMRTWRETGPCRHGSGEQYVRRHWYEIATAAGQVLRIYCERSARRGQARRRWWLFSIQEPD